MAAKKKPIFDYDICIACGICVQACPVSTLELQKTDVDVYKKAYPEMAREGCIGCGFCATNCPLDAVTMAELDAEGNPITPEKAKKEKKRLFGKRKVKTAEENIDNKTEESKQ